MKPEELRRALLNRALDGLTSEPALRVMQAVSGARARLRARLHDAAVTRLEQLGLATRLDLAGVEAELAALTDAVERLAQASAHLEAATRALSPQEPPP